MSSLPVLLLLCICSLKGLFGLIYGCLYINHYGSPPSSIVRNFINQIETVITLVAFLQNGYLIARHITSMEHFFLVYFECAHNSLIDIFFRLIVGLGNTRWQGGQAPYSNVFLHWDEHQHSIVNIYLSMCVNCEV